MNKNGLTDIGKDLAKGIVESGDINAMLFALVFVVSIIAIVAAAAVQPLVLIALVVLPAFFVWRIPSITRAGRARRAKEKVLTYLGGICRAVSAIASLDQDSVRSNVFRQSSDGRLRIVPGWHYNMDDRPAELSIAVPEGIGASGNAFQQRASVIARAKGGWGQHILSLREMEKVHPGLKWIVSVPIPKPNGGGEVLGILNVDGLYQDRTIAQLKPVLDQLLYWSVPIAEEIQHLS